MKFVIHMAVCTPATPLMFQSAVPSYLWLMKKNTAETAKGRLMDAKTTRYALAPINSSPVSSKISIEMCTGKSHLYSFESAVHSGNA